MSAVFPNTTNGYFIGGYTPGSEEEATPFWVSFFMKPTEAVNDYLYTITDDTDTGTDNLAVGSFVSTSGDPITGFAHFDNGGGVSAIPSNNFELNTWSHVLCEYKASDLRECILNGDTANKGVNTDDKNFPPAANVIVLGTRYLATGPSALWYNGKLAYFALGLGLLTDDQRAAILLGYHPRVLGSHGFGEVTLEVDQPLEAAINEVEGGVSLTNAGAVTFDSEDNPEIIQTEGSISGSNTVPQSRIILPPVKSLIRSPVRAITG